jgi:predicted porin
LLTANYDASRRLAQSINYVTPTMGGFTARAQVTSTNAQFDKTATNLKGRIVGIGADYTGGPLTVAAGWEKADDNRALGVVSGAKDTHWSLGAAYGFGPVKAGLTYTNSKAEALGVEVKKTAWNLGVDWMVTPAGTVRVGYTQASDFKGNGGAPDTGAKQWQIGYNHALSKRTTAGIAYVKLDNDSAGDYNLTGRTLDASGRNASAVVFSLTHTF